MADVESGVQTRKGEGLNTNLLNNTPWWLLILTLAGAILLIAMLRDGQYSSALAYILQGALLTVRVSAVAYIIALILGLIAGLGRISKNPLINTLATLYVEVMRGLPMLVIILYSQFVLAPQLGIQRNAELSGIIALAVGYGAYLAEVYRAGIESIERGQSEAARSLGMSSGETMRYIVLPQAIRRVLPPLGNDFIAMLKDSSLLSAIGVNELTQLARIEGSRTFDYFRAFNAAALLYLVLTILLSLGVRYIERRTQGGRR